MSGIMARPSDRPCRLIEWKPWPFDNQSLIGHAAVSFNGWTVHRIPVFRRADGSLSVGTPNAAGIDSDGRIRQRDGKKQYWSLMTFECTEARERWQRVVLAALSTAGIGEGVS
jgi:hypothetical protein